MRLDKYLKVSRIIKRRTVAKEACDVDRVTRNGKVSKPSSEVKVGDILTVKLGEKVMNIKVLSVQEHALKADETGMYEILSEGQE